MQVLGFRGLALGTSVASLFDAGMLLWLLQRTAFGLPEGTLFLFSFDYHSVFERKNPLGAVEAFLRAFPEPGEATATVADFVDTVVGAIVDQDLHDVVLAPNVALPPRNASATDPNAMKLTSMLNRSS